MNKRRLFSLILAGLLSAPVLVSCAEEHGNTGEKDYQSSTPDTAAETDKYDAARSCYEEIPDVDYEGGDYTIVAQQNVGSSETEIWVEKMDAQPVNDAVYTRNSRVGERFNCKIALKAGDVSSIIRQSVTSGDEVYKLAFPSLESAAAMAQAGWFLNYLDCDAINIRAPWWDQGTADLEIGGKVYFMCGDINILDNDVTYILLFNKKMIADQGMDEPYQLVRDQKWTIDCFGEMIKDVTDDSNGDGKFTDADTYGYVTTGEGPNTFFYGSGLKLVSFDSDKLPMLDINASKISDLLEKMKVIFTENNSTRIPGNYSIGSKMFTEDRVLFYGEVLSYVINLREMETPFGVLPIPKYDDAQEDYITYCESNASAVGIPMMTTEPDKVTAVLEALAIQSYLNLTPAYYDISLQRKYARDDESAEMLDIALAHRVYDIGRIYSSLGIKYVFGDLARAGSTDFASAWAKKQKAASRMLDKIANSFYEMSY